MNDWFSTHAARIARLAVVYILLMLTLTAIGLAISFKVTSNHVDEGLRDASVSACQRGNVVRLVATTSLNTLADIQIDVIQQQIAQTSAIPPKFFPSIPPAQFHRLVREQNTKARDQIDRLQQLEHAVTLAFAPVDCSSVNG